MNADPPPPSGSLAAHPSARSARSASASRLLIAFALAKLLLHLGTNLWGGYGIFRDELYYAACAEHLAAGYVDHPPLSVFVLALERLLLGDSLFALRLLPALAGAATVYVTGLIALELGGGAYAVASACLASIVSLIFLGVDAYYSMNAFDVLLWTLAAYVLVRLLASGESRLWPVLGLVLGLGALNKMSAVWFAAGIAAGVAATAERRWFRMRWPWIAGGVVAALFLPYVLWNGTHNFATLEFIRNASAGKYAGLTRADFVRGQVLFENPVTLPLWLAGLWFLLLGKGGKRFRPLGVAYVAVFAILIAHGHAKAEYLAPAYGFVFAAGGVAVERALSGLRLRLLRPVHLALLGAGLVLAPLALPVLPVATYVRYAETLGLRPSTAESKELAKLPQFFADMFGWEEKAAAVAQVFHGLTPQEQANCAVFADNYGRCGAIDYYRHRYGLPQAIGRHNNYWLWGPRDATGEIMIVLGGELEDQRRNFDSVQVAATVGHPYCMPYENDLDIFVCRGMKTPLREAWDRIKLYE